MAEVGSCLVCACFAKEAKNNNRTHGDGGEKQNKTKKTAQISQHLLHFLFLRHIHPAMHDHTSNLPAGASANTAPPRRSWEKFLRRDSRTARSALRATPVHRWAFTRQTRRRDTGWVNILNKKQKKKSNKKKDDEILCKPVMFRFPPHKTESEADVHTQDTRH